jgi:hypothetical protein
MTQSTDGAPTRCDIPRAACVEAPFAAASARVTTLSFGIGT